MEFRRGQPYCCPSSKHECGNVYHHSHTPIFCICLAESNQHPAAQRRELLDGIIYGSRERKRGGVEALGFRSLKINFIPPPVGCCYPSGYVYINTEVHSYSKLYRVLCGGGKMTLVFVALFFFKY